MSVAHTRVVVDGMVIRAVKEPVPSCVKHYPIKSAYPIEVDGVRRGYLVNQRPGYSARSGHTGWAIRSLLPYDKTRPHDNEARFIAATTYGEAKNVLARIPDLIAKGLMPTEAEAAPVIADLIQKANEWAAGAPQREADRLEANSEAERRRVEAVARQATERAMAVEGLESIGATHPLTNFERVAIEHALKILRKPQ